MQPIAWQELREPLLRRTPPPYGWRHPEPVLTPAELDDLQRQIGVDLPADYQQYLLHIGRGGPGPFSGVIPVRHTGGRWTWHGDGYAFDPAHLAEPFPLRRSDWQLVEDLGAEYPDWFTFARQRGYEDAVDAWHRRHDGIVFDPRRTYGAIPICDEGCALREWLVVTGPERGNIWLDHRADGRGLTPAWLPHHRRVAFAQWYHEWLRTLDDAPA
ncbi:SMI1/KNR4 family protein [Dactylosporangium sp. NPDC000244]|uniref:SMI1/KNR4 family protein n=1 Tax=Dactylosporangium sp. NPDC000244 TaxID=3154365 RepID=UPI0033288F5A